MTDKTPAVPDPQDTLLDELVRRVSEAGLESEMVDGPRSPIAEDERSTFLRIHFPNGRHTRQLLVRGSRVGRLLKTPFENVTFLGDFDAFFDRSSGTAEAHVVGAEATFRSGPWTLPGAETLNGPSTGDDDQDDPDQALLSSRTAPENWRLRVTRGEQTLELSPISETARVFFGGPPRTRVFTLKLSGLPTDRHDDALELLENLGNAFLFELDVLYRASYALRRRRNPSRLFKQEAASQPPRFPRNKYSGQALALYQYARAATGLPLLAYLAYYQSVEYFFPVFAKEQTVKALRTALMNPRFDPTDDTSVSRLISLATPSSRSGLGERDQLRATVRACIEADELLHFIQSSELFTEHFCSKKQSIRGVQPIRLQGDQLDLRDQVSDRIYAIRCRVVHTKEDGGLPGGDLLLPSSDEANSLSADIELVRLVAQQALSARATRS